MKGRIGMLVSSFSVEKGIRSRKGERYVGNIRASKRKKRWKARK
jgi:hypothetical protein